MKTKPGVLIWRKRRNGQTSSLGSRAVPENGKIAPDVGAGALWDGAIYVAKNRPETAALVKTLWGRVLLKTISFLLTM